MRTEQGENGKNYSLIRQLIKSINIQLYIYLEIIMETNGISEEVVAKVTQINEIRKNIHGVLNKCIEEYATNVDNFSNGNVPNYRSEERATFNGFLTSYLNLSQKVLNSEIEIQQLAEKSGLRNIIGRNEVILRNLESKHTALAHEIENIRAKQGSVPRALYKKMNNQQNIISKFLAKHGMSVENFTRLTNGIENININQYRSEA
jgi:hypothetical protein